MKPVRTQRGQVLILIAAWVFFTGGAVSALVVYGDSGADTKKAIKRVITDRSRERELLSYIDYWENGQEGRDKKVIKDRDEVFEALSRKDGSRADVEPILKGMDTTFAEMDRDFIELRFRLKEHVSKEEWAEIISSRDR